MSTRYYKPAAFNPISTYAPHIVEASDGEWTDFEGEDEDKLLFLKGKAYKAKLYKLRDQLEYEDDIEVIEQNHIEQNRGDNIRRKNSKTSEHSSNRAAGSYNFYPEQPYVRLPTVPKPRPEGSSKLKNYFFSPIYDVSKIYLKFLLLAMLIYGCALLYGYYFGDLSSLKDSDVDFDDEEAYEEAYTCIAEYLK